MRRLFIALLVLFLGLGVVYAAPKQTSKNNKNEQINNETKRRY